MNIEHNSDIYKHFEPYQYYEYNCVICECVSPQPARGVAEANLIDRWRQEAAERRSAAVDLPPEEKQGETGGGCLRQKVIQKWSTQERTEMQNSRFSMKYW